MFVMLFRIRPSVSKLGLKATLFESTPSPTTCFVKTSKQLAPVQTVCPKVCDVRSERTSEPLHVSSVDNV